MIRFSGFEVVQDLTDLTEVIKHVETDVYLKVLEEHNQKSKFPSDEFVIEAHFYSRSLTGRRIPEHSKKLQFKLLRFRYGKRPFLEAEVLTEAVKYYCIHHVGQRIDKMMVWFNGRLMPFEDDYAFADA